MSKDMKKDLAEHILRSTLNNKGKVQVVKRTVPRFNAMNKLAARERKMHGEVKLRRRLAVILADNDRINELFQLWIAERKTKEDFAKYVLRRLKGEHCA